jgi:hypothetical protein
MTVEKRGDSLEMDRCPHCSIAHPNFVLKTHFDTTARGSRYTRRWSIFICNSCSGVVTISSLPNGANSVLELFPSTRTLDSSIPSKAAEFLRQALESIHSPAASIMVAASALDEMLKQKGFKDGKLFPRIKNAAESHLITSEMATWAHEIRLEANEQRHADEDSSLPTAEDAKRVLDFALALAEFLFVLPSRVRKGISDAKTEK